MNGHDRVCEYDRWNDLWERKFIYDNGREIATSLPIGQRAWPGGTFRIEN